MAELDNRAGVLGATSMVGVNLLPLLVKATYQVFAYSRHTVENLDDKIEWRKISHF